MKIITTLSLLLLMMNLVYGQDEQSDKKEIRKIIHLFQTSIITKDSVTFDSLFSKGNVNWIGVVKDRSQQKRIQANPDIKKSDYPGTYERFFQYVLMKGKKEEKFKNIRITNDDVIASVTFDYSFWVDNKMTNWGKECWHLIKINGKWEITGIIFSIELSKYFPKPGN